MAALVNRRGNVGRIVYIIGSSVRRVDHLRSLQLDRSRTVVHVVDRDRTGLRHVGVGIGRASLGDGLTLGIGVPAASLIAGIRRAGGDVAIGQRVAAGLRRLPILRQREHLRHAGAVVAPLTVLHLEGHFSLVLVGNTVRTAIGSDRVHIPLRRVGGVSTHRFSNRRIPTAKRVAGLGGFSNGRGGSTVGQVGIDQLLSGRGTTAQIIRHRIRIFRHILPIESCILRNRIVGEIDHITFAGLVVIPANEVVLQAVRFILLRGCGNLVVRYKTTFFYNELGSFTGCCKLCISRLHDLKRYIEHILGDDLYNAIDMPSPGPSRNNTILQLLFISCCAGACM